MEELLSVNGLSQHEKGKYHSLTYKIVTAKVIVSYDPIFTGKKYTSK